MKILNLHQMWTMRQLATLPGNRKRSDPIDTSNQHVAIHMYYSKNRGGLKESRCPTYGTSQERQVR